MGRWALITGASAGLGEEFARQLAAEGWHLILAARRLERLEQVAKACQSINAQIETRTMAVDFGDLKAVDRLLSEVADLNIDFLVNNAGSGGPDLLDAEIPWADQAAYLNLMMFSVAQLCHGLVPKMVERGYGRVINVASVAGRMVRPGDVSYGPTKAYLVSLAEGMAPLKKEGVHVCALCPGFTHTEFHAEGELAEMKAGLPEFVWYDAETVVREGLSAVERGRSVYVSGRLYRWIDSALRLKLTAWLMRKFA